MNLKTLLNARRRVLFVGPPGCAKTARIHAVAKECGYKTVVVRVSLTERIDFGGALIADLANGVTRALPLEWLRDLKSSKEKWLLFCDDLGQAPMDAQAALMKLFDSGELPDNVVIWGATNRPGDKAGVTALCEPLRSRFHVAFAIPTPGSAEKADGAVFLSDWKEELQGWCDWALDHSIPAEIVAWHRSTLGSDLYAWAPHADPGVRLPDYRSWETVGLNWQDGMRDLQIVSAAIGKPHAAKFLAFTKLAEKLPSPQQVFDDPEGAPVPEDNSALYLISATLPAAIVKVELSTPPTAAEQKAKKLQREQADAVIQYMGRLPRVYAALCGRDMYRKLGAPMCDSKHWKKWFEANAALFGFGA